MAANPRHGEVWLADMGLTAKKALVKACALWRIPDSTQGRQDSKPRRVSVRAFAPRRRNLSGAFSTKATLRNAFPPFTCLACLMLVCIPFWGCRSVPPPVRENEVERGEGRGIGVPRSEPRVVAHFPKESQHLST